MKCWTHWTRNQQELQESHNKGLTISCRHRRNRSIIKWRGQWCHKVDSTFWSSLHEAAFGYFNHNVHKAWKLFVIPLLLTGPFTQIRAISQYRNQTWTCLARETSPLPISDSYKQKQTQCCLFFLINKADIPDASKLNFSWSCIFKASK